MSRARAPKHLLRLFSERTLLEETILRLRGVVAPSEHLDPHERVAGPAHPRGAARVSEGPDRRRAREAGHGARPPRSRPGLVRARDPDGVVALLPADALIGNGGALRRSSWRRRSPGRRRGTGRARPRPAHLRRPADPPGDGLRLPGARRRAREGRRRQPPPAREALRREARRGDRAGLRRERALRLERGDVRLGRGAVPRRGRAHGARARRVRPGLPGGRPRRATSFARFASAAQDLGRLRRPREGRGRSRPSSRISTGTTSGRGPRSQSTCRPTRSGNVSRGPVVSVGTSGTIAVSNGRVIALCGVKDLVVVETARRAARVPQGCRAGHQELMPLLPKDAGLGAAIRQGPIPMLQSLRIRNLALLEHVSVDFEAGLRRGHRRDRRGQEHPDRRARPPGGRARGQGDHPAGGAGVRGRGLAPLQGPAAGSTRCLPSWTCPPCEEGLLVLKRSVPRERAPKITVNGAWPRSRRCSASASAGSTSTARASPGACSGNRASSSSWTSTAGPGRRSRPTARATGRGATSRRRASALRRRRGSRPDELAFMEAQLARLDRLDLSEEAIAALERDFQRMSRAQEIAALASALEAGSRARTGRCRGWRRSCARRAASSRSIPRARRSPTAWRRPRPSSSSSRRNSRRSGASSRPTPTALGPARGAHERLARGQAAPRARCPLGRRGARGDAPARVVAGRHRGDARAPGPGRSRRRRARRGSPPPRCGRCAQKAARELARAAAAGIAELGFDKAEFRISITDAPGPRPHGRLRMRIPLLAERRRAAASA